MPPPVGGPRLSHIAQLPTSSGTSPYALADQVSSPLDQFFRAPGATRDITMRQLFTALRQVGLRPHAHGPERDAQVAAKLLTALRASTATLSAERPPTVARTTAATSSTTATARSAGSPDSGPADDSIELDSPNALNEPEAGLTPSPWFGVAEPACPATEDNERKYGTTIQIINDLRDMGAGSIRRCKERDVYWGSVFPIAGSESKYFIGKLVPPPDQILSELRADDFAVLGHFMELLLACRLAGIEFAITPFDSGGGSAMNPRSSGDAANNDDNFPLEDVYSDELPEPRRDFPNGWTIVYNNRPDWQNGVRVPSTQGWDEFYWNHGSPATYGQQLFQRFAIQVWPIQTPSMEDTSLGEAESSDYTRECARRKSLAIAAFSQGVAEFLASVDRVWSLLFDDRTDNDSGGIYQVVQVVELGNELNGMFKSRGDHDSLEFVAGEHEAGRYMVLVAAPFRWLLPGMRFRASELSSWRNEEETGDCFPEEHCCASDDYADRLAWLHGAIGTGMAWAWGVEVRNQYLLALWSMGAYPGELPEAVVDWHLTCNAADYWWPPWVTDISDTMSFGVTELVDEVGFHWFHGNNRGVDEKLDITYGWIPGYQDAIRLQKDVDDLQSEVVESLAASGFQLSITAGAVLFDAVQPIPYVTETITADYYQGANTLLQAGLVARFMFFFRTAGFTRMSWFCPLLQPIDADDDGVPSEWKGASNGTGLHNDIKRPSDGRDFAAAAAWRRPAWFTYRRVAWLLSQTDDAGSLAYNHHGLTIIRYRLASRLAIASDGSLATGGGHRYLWIMWLDQYADSTCLHDSYLEDAETRPTSSVGPDETTVYLYDAFGRGYQLLSLVPWVTASEDPTATDANGYRQVTARDWTWVGWDGAIVAHDELFPATSSEPGLSKYCGVIESIISVRLRKADSTLAPAPVAIVTDAEYLVR